ncbi:MAG: molecular chaperone DnaJ [Polyangia bacterium]
MAQNRRDFYEILGVPRNADADELKRSYRTLALKYHPDHNQNDKQAEERFKEVSAAYAVLSDPEKRMRYDRLGQVGLTTTVPGLDQLNLDLDAFKDLFDNLFGDLLGRKKGRASGRDLRYTLELSLEEAAHGAQKVIRVPVRSECGACSGTGGKDGEAGLRVCRTCGGKGDVKSSGLLPLNKTCTTCHGTGKEVATPCPACRGSGLVDKPREFTVSVPAGTEDGAARRLPGQGEPGRRGGPSGDLNVTIQVRPHPLLKREGPLLTLDLPLHFAQVATGCTVDIPTLEGPVEMKVPPGTQSGTIFRLRGKGFPTAVGATTRGDLHVKALVETPQGLSEHQRGQLRDMFERLPATAFPQRQRYLEQLKSLYGPQDTTTTPLTRSAKK